MTFLLNCDKCDCLKAFIDNGDTARRVYEYVKENVPGWATENYTIELTLSAKLNGDKVYLFIYLICHGYVKNGNLM